MTIEFSCPKTQQISTFPDAYGGTRYRCKFCSEFHTLPRKEDYVNKDLLAICPKTDEVVSVDTSVSANLFKCAICGDIHEIPGEHQDTNTDLIASSTKYQKQSRQKVIPSVRKQSPFSSSSVTTPSVVKATTPSPKTEQKKYPSSTTTAAVKKQREYTERRAAKEIQETYTAHKKKKSGSFLASLFILMILGVVGVVVWYVFSQSEINSSSIEQINQEYLQAEREASEGNFEKAIKLSENTLKVIHQNPQIRTKLNIQEFESKNATYKSQKEIFDKILTTFQKVIEDNTIRPSGIEEALEQLQVAKNGITGQPSFLTPIDTGITKIRNQLLEKHYDLIRKAIEEDLRKAEKLVEDLQFFDAMHIVRETQTLLQQQPKEHQDRLTNQFQSQLNVLTAKQKTFENIHSLTDKKVTNTILLPEVEKELRTASMQPTYEYPIFKKLLEKRIEEIAEEKKKSDLIKISTALSETSETIQNLRDFSATVPLYYSIRKEAAKAIYRKNASTPPQEQAPYQTQPIEVLKKIATEIASQLNEGKGDLTLKIESDKGLISWSEDSIPYRIGLINIDNAGYYVIEKKGIPIAFTQSFFEKNMAFTIHYANYLADAITLSAENTDNSSSPWIVRDAFLLWNAPMAILNIDSETKLFFINKIYTVTENKDEKQTQPSDLIAAFERFKTIILSSKETIDTKFKLLAWSEQIKTRSTEPLSALHTLLGELISTKPSTNDAICQNAITDLIGKITISQKATLSLTATNQKKDLVQISVNQHQIPTARIFLAEKLETHFLVVPQIRYGTRYADSTLNFSYLHSYHGNFEQLPQEAPASITLVHPLTGAIGQYDSLSKKAVYSHSGYDAALALSQLFGENGQTRTTLPFHILRLNEAGQIREIITQNFTCDLNPSYQNTPLSFKTWCEKNKKLLTSPELLNLFLFYLNSNAPLQSVLESPSSSDNTSTNLYKVTLAEFATYYSNPNTSASNFVTDIISIAQRPIILLASTEKDFPIWVEYQFQKVNYCYLYKGFVNRQPIEDPLKDLKTILDKIFPNQINNVYNIPITISDAQEQKRMVVETSGLLCTNLISDNTRKRILNALKELSPIAINNTITLNLNATLVEAGLFKYQQEKNLNNYLEAVEHFEKGIQAIQKEKTISAKMELEKLWRAANKSKNAITLTEEIYTGVTKNSSFQEEPDRFLDYRCYLAEQCVKIGKTKELSALLQIKPDTINDNVLLLQSAVTSCCLARQLQEKDKISSDEFNTTISPILKNLEKPLATYLAKPKYHLKHFLEANEIWFKYQIALKGSDYAYQILLSSISNADSFTLQSEDINTHISWIKVNPLCYYLLVQTSLTDINLNDEVELKQKLNISTKLMDNYLSNFNKKAGLWHTQPYPEIAQLFIVSTAMHNNQSEDIAEKLKPIIATSQYDDILYLYLANYTATLTTTNFIDFIEGTIQAKYPSYFYRKVYAKMMHIKNNTKTKTFLSIIKDKLANRPNLIADLEKISGSF